MQSRLTHDYVKFNLWANRRLIDWLGSNDLAKLDEEVPSSMNTIKKTLDHSLTAQCWWYSILTTSKFELPARESFAQSSDSLIQSCNDYIDFLNDKTDDEMSAKVEVRARFFTGEVPIHQIVQHVVNHGTYHRGQIITMAKHLDMNKPPVTDYFHAINSL